MIVKFAVADKFCCGSVQVKRKSGVGGRGGTEL